MDILDAHTDCGGRKELDTPFTLACDACTFVNFKALRDSNLQCTGWATFPQYSLWRYSDSEQALPFLSPDQEFVSKQWRNPTH